MSADTEQLLRGEGGRGEGEDLALPLHKLGEEASVWGDEAALGSDEEEGVSEGPAEAPHAVCCVA